MELKIQIKEWRGNFLHILDLYRKSLLLVKGKGKGKGKGEGDAQTSDDCLPRLGGVKYRTVEPRVATNVDCYNSLWKMVASDSKHPDLMRSATELTEAGIGFRKSETRYLNNTPWYVWGTLRLPRVTVDDTFQSLYLNLMAFERLHAGGGGGDEVMNEVTSYVFFMDRLIDTAKDVALLHRHGIVENFLGSDDDAAKLFNRLTIDICLDNGKTIELQEEVGRKYRKRGIRWLAFAKHNYCINPWVIATIAGGILMFLFTATQTTYAIVA